MPWTASIVPDYGITKITEFASARWGCVLEGVSGANYRRMGCTNFHTNNQLDWLMFQHETSDLCAKWEDFQGKNIGYVLPFAAFKIFAQVVGSEEVIWTGKYVFVGLQLDMMVDAEKRVNLVYGTLHANHTVENVVRFTDEPLIVAAPAAEIRVGYTEITEDNITYSGFMLVSYDTTLAVPIRLSSWAVRKDTFGGMLTSSQSTDIEVVTDPNADDPDPETEEGGGGGSHDPSSDIVPEEDITTLNSIKGGFITYYKITDAQLDNLADEVFSATIWDAIKNYFEKPQEIIAGLMLLPITPASGSSYYPKYGVNVLNDFALPEVAARFVEVSCGSIYVDEYYASCFDYSPYTQISIYLPFIGVRDIDVDEVMGKWITVKYRIDCYTGNCLATILVGDGTAGSNTVRYQFAGNCGQQMPISSTDFSQVINGAIQFATVAVASIATAGAAGSAAGTAALSKGAEISEAGTVAASAQAAAEQKAAADIGGAAVSNVMNSKPIVTRSGSVGESIGMMSVLTPYIIKKVPRQSRPNKYNTFYGYPSNMSGTIGSFAGTGFTVVDTVKLKGIPATDGEIAEIERVLKGGIYL